MKLRQIEEVPEDSVDAKKWPTWNNETVTEASEVATKPVGSGMSAVQLDSPRSTDTIAATSPTTQSNNAPKPSLPIETSVKTTQVPRPGPPPKKRKTLGDIPSAKPKKISTLDKSLMDWSSHVGSSSNQQIREELEANRRGGGFIEKVEFMERVSGRKEEGRALLAGSKRRR